MFFQLISLQFYLPQVGAVSEISAFTSIQWRNKIEFSFLVLTSVNILHLKNSTSTSFFQKLCCPYLIHRTHCQPFSWRLFLQQKIGPVETAHGNACGLSSQGHCSQKEVSSDFFKNVIFSPVRTSNKIPFTYIVLGGSK